MLLAAITAYSVSVFIHITAVVVGFGATFAEAIMFPVAQKLDPKHLPYVHRLQMAINQRLATPALLVVIVTGIYQVNDGGMGTGENVVGAISDSNGSPFTFARTMSTSRCPAVCSTKRSRIRPRGK